MQNVEKQIQKESMYEEEKKKRKEKLHIIYMHKTSDKTVMIIHRS